jgi:hypothetical protein
MVERGGEAYVVYYATFKLEPFRAITLQTREFVLLLSYVYVTCDH